MKYELVNLIKDDDQAIYNMTVQEAIETLEQGEAKAVNQIDGQFALAAFSRGRCVLARTLGIPQRYFIFDHQAVQYFVVAERISELRDYYIRTTGRKDFDYRASVMVSAHYLVSVDVCDPARMQHQRFFNPRGRTPLEPDIERIGHEYVSAVREEIEEALRYIPHNQPIAVAFSGGVDSTCILALLLHALQGRGNRGDRLKAYTLAIDGGGPDLAHARTVAETFNFPDHCLEVLNADSSELHREETIALLEDYYPADVEMGVVNALFIEKLKKAHPEIRFIFDGEGGNENLLDYPLNDSRYPPIELSTLIDNPLLFLEGRPPGDPRYKSWCSSGLSRGYVRTFNVYKKYGIQGFSPYLARSVISTAMRIPFRALCQTPEELAQLKGKIVRAGLKQVCGVDIPVFPKIRFQEGVASENIFMKKISVTHQETKKVFEKMMR